MAEAAPDFYDSGFIPFLPSSLVCQIASHCSFLTWSSFAITNKFIYEQFGVDGGANYSRHLLLKVSLDAEAGAINRAISKYGETNVVKHISKYLQIAVTLEIKNLPSFTDLGLRILFDNCPHVSNLALYSLKSIRGSLVNVDSNDPELESTDVDMEIPENRPPSALELWCGRIKSLKLVEIHIRGSRLERMCKKFNNLQRLEISGRSVLPFRSLHEYVPNITTFVLENTWIIEPESLTTWCRNLPPTLTSLVYRNVPTLHDSALCNAVGRVGRSLTSLEIKYNSQLSANSIICIKDNCPMLKSLSIGRLHKSIPSYVWVQLASSLPHIEYLDLSNNPNVDDLVVEALALNSTSLQDLNLRGTLITTKSIESLANTCKKLNYLDVSSCVQLEGLPGINQLSRLMRLAAPECSGLNISMLHQNLNDISLYCKYMVKYDLSFTNVDDQVVQCILENAFWLGHLSVIGCGALTDITLNNVDSLLSHPHHTSSFFSLQICRTPLITASGIRHLKQKYMPLALQRYLKAQVNQSQQLNAVFSVQVLARSVADDRMTTTCDRGGCVTKRSTCQCGLSHIQVEEKKYKIERLD